METVIRNVRDLDALDRSALERVVGHELSEAQQVVVNVVNIEAPHADSADQGQLNAEVPDWWKIYEGLSEEVVDELDRAIRYCSGGEMRQVISS